MFRARRRAAPHRDARPNTWERKLRWPPMRRGRSTRCGMRARDTADRNGFIFRLLQRVGRAGRRRQTSRLRMIRWSIVFPRLLRARQAMCVSRGWTRANLLYGMFSSVVPAMAALPGRWRANSRGRCGVTIMCGLRVSAFHSATTSPSPSITSETRMRCGVRGGTSSLLDRFGIRTEGSQAQFSVLSKTSTFIQQLQD
jgi:hypothetical protein